LLVNTGQLTVREGAQISTAATDGSTGQAGSLEIGATESVTVRGSTIEARSETAQGAGDLTIRTPVFTVDQGASVNVSSTGTGPAGDLTVTADQIRLDRGQLNATTQGGQGNINLLAPEIILVNQSRIITNAAGRGNGGNLFLDTDVLLGLGNSDITANALAGTGGLLTIDAAIGIFGFTIRTRDSLQQLQGQANLSNFNLEQLATNDITSFTQDPTAAATVPQDCFGIQTPEADPGQGLTRLSEVVDLTGLITNTCAADLGNYFAFTGRGGIPLSDHQVLGASTLWEDWRWHGSELETVDRTTTSNSTPTFSTPGSHADASGRTVPLASPTLPPILPHVHPPMEAQGWQMTGQGHIRLVAKGSTPYAPELLLADCAALSQ
jgi:hypothetical protein